MDREIPTLVRTDVALAASSAPQVSAATPLRGSVLVLIQFDVCEEIRLDVLRTIFGARTAATSFKLPFSGGWDTLVELSCRWTSDTNFEALASRIVKQKLERAAPALVKPYKEWLTEDYFIFHVREIAGSPSANDLLAARADEISQIVRGEMAKLSDGERQEVLQSKISYYPNDLAVIGWNAAYIYDDPAGAETAIQLLQYANSQLLEFRHYDDLLTKELEKVYDFLDRGGRGLWSRWRTAKAASKLHTVLLDVG